MDVISRKKLITRKNTASKSTDHPDAVEEITPVSYPIVGIGASAGGLEACTALLKALPTNTGMAFVLVQHLAPTHDSMLTELLSRSTAMPVVEIEDGMHIVPNHVYVIPPNTNLGILHGVLHLMPRKETTGHYLPIDYFMRALAEDQGSKAIGIILSGTASDGVLGMKEIKSVGGITFAQDEETAAYPGMPHSAIAAGCVDFVLSPTDIAAELSRLSSHPYITGVLGTKGEADLEEGNEDLGKVFFLLRKQTGNDFTYYKPSTIQRRIKRRMLLNKIVRLGDYVRHLQRTPQEVEALFHDILIHVTSFFREAQAFDELKKCVFPTIMQDRLPQSPVRIWIPGCSTGEEVYSIAISLLEFLGDKASQTPIQIFATDLDEQAIEQARIGIYPEAIIQSVTAERLRQFFIKVEQGYQVNRQIRELCVFSRQNVFKDPPFSRLDLISCRNLLIYLGSTLQNKVLPIFHYALKPNGYLLLGISETIGRFADLFRLVEKKHKIYIKKAAHTQVFFESAGGIPRRYAREEGQQPQLDRPAWGGLDLSREVDRLLLKKFAPPGVVVNEDLDIIQFRGHTGAYLEPAPGEASLKLLKMAREALQIELQDATRQAIMTNLSARRDDVRLYGNGEIRLITLEVDPIRSTTSNGKFYLVTFQESPLKAIESSKIDQSRFEAHAKADEDNEELSRLREELAASKEYLHSIIEQQEVSNEELTSANEEIQASNEELQSINEELETAKEELQSTNEELATVNDELQSRNTDLELLSNDLGNLIGGISTAIVMVDRELRIRRFTVEAEKCLNLIATDQGRPITHIKPNILIPDLEKLLLRVIDTVTPEKLEVQDIHEHWYAVHIHPYKTSDNKIDGAVLAYFDINVIKQSLAQAELARDFAEGIVAAMRHPMLVLDRHLRVVSASAAFYTAFKVTPKETVGNLLYQLGNGQWGIPQLRQQLESTLKSSAGFDDYIVEHDFEMIGHRMMSVSGRVIAKGLDNQPMILMQIEDCTHKT